MQQLEMYDLIYPAYKFNKKNITIFECFAGYGSQSLALKRLEKKYNFKVENLGYSEIDVKAIKAYELLNGLTENYGDIKNIINIPQVDIFTYSFPCQDISNAGKGKGITKNTRSGLLFEVERLLKNQLKINKLPKILLMENVPNLVYKYKSVFDKFLLFLEKLGYSNHWDIVNSKNFGIPHSRDRVFCFSILGEYNYVFPKLNINYNIKSILDADLDNKTFNHSFPFDPGNGFIKVVNATKKGYDLAYPFDTVNMTFPNSITKRGRVGKKICKTLPTNCEMGIVTENLKLRRFSVKECLRLMDMEELHIDLLIKNIDVTSLKKMAGNSIVIRVLEKLFEQFFN